MLRNTIHVITHKWTWLNWECNYMVDKITQNCQKALLRVDGQLKSIKDQSRISREPLRNTARKHGYKHNLTFWKAIIEHLWGWVIRVEQLDLIIAHMNITEFSANIRSQLRYGHVKLSSRRLPWLDLLRDSGWLSWYFVLNHVHQIQH